MLIGKIKTIVLLSYICIASISAAMITPALPKINQVFHLTDGSLAWVVSIFLFGYVIGQLIYGPLANRFGRLTALRSGLIINLIGIALCIIAAWLENYHLLLAGRFVTALGAAAGLSCTFMLLNELLTEEQAKHAMSFAIVAFTVGIGLSVTLGGLITQYLSWQDCFWLLLAHGTLMLILTWQFPETLKQVRSLKPLLLLSGYLQALKSIRLITFSLLIGLSSAVAYCYSAAAPVIAQTLLHLSPSHYGYWNLVNMLGMLGSGFLNAYLIKRYDASKVLLLSLSMMIPCFISLALLSMSHHVNVAWFFISTMSLYLFSGMLFPTASFFALTAIQDKANASSMMSFINMGSAMISVIIMGYLPIPTLNALLATLCGFYMLALILFYRLRKHKISTI